MIDLAKYAMAEERGRKSNDRAPAQIRPVNEEVRRPALVGAADLSTGGSAGWPNQPKTTAASGAESSMSLRKRRGIGTSSNDNGVLQMKTMSDDDQKRKRRQIQIDNDKQEKGKATANSDRCQAESGDTMHTSWTHETNSKNKSKSAEQCETGNRGKSKDALPDSQAELRAERLYADWIALRDRRLAENKRRKQKFLPVDDEFDSILTSNDDVTTTIMMMHKKELTHPMACGLNRCENFYR